MAATCLTAKPCARPISNTAGLDDESGVGYWVLGVREKLLTQYLIPNPQHPRTNMRILITGGAGFIGSHLTDQLLAEGHQVVAMDNLLTGDVANIEHHRSNPH